ncbi:hypothetical protein BJX61DRAFT_253851 [Aspergillus egyptiacus]|nr:hypothetical protein BJX61DRAFT_253851 [Aspergillus egyptiacus]
MALNDHWSGKTVDATARPMRTLCAFDSAYILSHCRIGRMLQVQDVFSCILDAKHVILACTCVSGVFLSPLFRPDLASVMPQPLTVRFMTTGRKVNSSFQPSNWNHGCALLMSKRMLSARANRRASSLLLAWNQVPVILRKQRLLSGSFSLTSFSILQVYSIRGQIFQSLKSYANRPVIRHPRTST